MTSENAATLDPERQPATPETKRMSPGLFLVCALAVYITFNLVVPMVRVPRHGLTPPVALAVLLLPTAVFMLLQLILTLAFVRLRLRGFPSLLVLFGAITVGVLMIMLVGPHRLFHAGPTWWKIQPTLLGLTVTTACTFFGALLSRIVRAPNVLLPIAVISMPIDYLGAMTPIGFTQNVVAKHPDIVKHVSVAVPQVHGLTFHGLTIQGLIGPGDVCFMAFFFAVALRLNMNVRGTFWWMYGLLAAAMCFVLVFGLNIAALVPMGAAALAANWRFFKFQRSEVFAMIYAGLIVMALVVSFYFYSHTHFFRGS